MRSFTSKLAPIIREYLEYRNMLGYSNEQEYYLAMFDAYFREHYPDLDTLTEESVRGWVKFEILQKHGGIQYKSSAVRMLALYMGSGAYILPKMSAPKRPKYVPYIMSDGELSRLFAAADNIKGKTDKSVKLMFPTLLRLLYTCGLRPTEVRLTKRDNINFITGEILLEKTKGHKERIIVMSKDMLEQCRKYDTIRAIANPQSEYFFVRADGTHLPAYQLAITFKLCWKQSNPDVPANMLPRVRPYDLRHRYASTILQKWLNEGRDFYAMLPYLRAYMGHEKLSHTAYYIHLLPENLLNSSGVDWSAIDAINPEVEIWRS